MTKTDTSRTTPPAWDDAALKDPHAKADKAVRVEAMFDAIAGTYERVNTVVSLGRDALWRRRAVAAANVLPGDVVLDVCCGTGDMIRAFCAGHNRPGMMLGVDFAARMLARGTYDGIATPIHLCRADALRLPLADESVDVVSCAFGVRSFQDLRAGLHEMHRAMRPGGRMVILEFATPDNALLRWGYRCYCEVILPRLARWVSRDRVGAYRYLPKSIDTFERAEELARWLETAGFVNLSLQRMNLGGVVLYRGEKAQCGPRRTPTT